MVITFIKNQKKGEIIPEIEEVLIINRLIGGDLN